MADSNGWEQQKIYILASLDRLEKVIGKVDDRCINRVHDCFVNITKEAKEGNNFFTGISDRLSTIEVKIKLITYIGGAIFSAIIGLLLKLLFEKG